ncbi:hypothetical protein LUZ60_004299 [Juncus effusus]|nr:hypothetical protein LUZ60_004299 [Juncus effusus]
MPIALLNAAKTSPLSPSSMADDEPSFETHHHDSTASKKHKKKKKSSSAAAPSSPIPVAQDSVPIPIPAQKHKKRKNKSDPTHETHQEESTEETNKKKSKRKKLKIKLEAIPDCPDKTPPVVGYFPSGFKPNNHADGTAFDLYRHVRHPNRLEAVVRPENSNVEFVGTSYAGEAAAPQLCTYALGVFDKEAKTLKIVPIAANKILRFEPRVKRDEEPAQSEGLTELSATGKSEKKIQDLTSIYGTKHDKSRDRKFKTLIDQKNYDLGEGAEFLKSQDQELEQEAETVDKSTGSGTFRNIPPYDPSVDVAEKVYDLGKIIPSGERPHLMAILDDYRNDNKVVNYPSFVKNRLNKLNKAKDAEREKLAIILSYITHLHSIWDRYRKPPSKSNDSNSKQTPFIPRITRQRLTSLFVDTESKLLSTDKLELLIGYILVLTLFVDDFSTDASDVAKDLMMTTQGLKPYFMQLGCRYEKGAVGKKGRWGLSVPLEFADMRKRTIKKDHIK